MLVFFTNLSLMEFQVRYLVLFLLFSVIEIFEWFWLGSLHKNIYADDTTLYSNYDQASDLWKQLQLTFELESDLRDTVDWGRKWFVDFNAGKTQLVLFDQSNNYGAIDVKMDGSVFEEKSSFMMLGLTFSYKLDWVSYIISISKTASKKIGALIRSMKFLSPEVALYLYKSTIHLCMECYCHVWAGAPSCY